MSARNALFSFFAAGALLFGCSTAGTNVPDARGPAGSTCACTAKSKKSANARADAPPDSAQRYKALH